ncbi:hypothetical protein CHS0354_000752 [Potamilus streckersoni]|uniref:ATP-grasp domain-containing protein n=1 Tax=Potamilus streckersoni TaxID=2493646 RepID=A0AAE0W878_9BIVA|nr:hypothetical protein CHS0354_000752 [Potamilus streckersoni]
MHQCHEKGIVPEWLFWVGCAGSFDERAKKITTALAKICLKAGVSFAVLGTEERCTGDPAKRVGNEFLFQTAAIQNISLLEKYGIKKILTQCPHCFNTLKNEYTELGGHYDVLHYTEFLLMLIQNGRLKINNDIMAGTKIAFHDPCYLGRGNGIYEAPRMLIKTLNAEIVELKRNREKSFCCGAGGGQMFKESEQGKKEINIERAEEVVATGVKTVAVGCPFCKMMLTDGFKELNQPVQAKDICEMVLEAMLIMAKKHVNVDFHAVKQADLATMASNIVDTMKVNVALFPKPEPSLENITALISAYTTVLDKTEYAGQTADIKKARVALIAGLKQLGEYVNSIADGDEAILEKSGFPISKVPTRHGDIPATTEAGVSLNEDGGFDIWATLVDKSYNGVLFAFTEVSNPESDPYNWTIRYSPVSNTTISSGYTKGAGPIVIGQACEFDYSGTQACRALKEEGYRVILINSNPATIMTDISVADRTYIEPITPDYVEKIIKKENPDALLPTMGGQTALNVAVHLAESGFLERNGVELIGAKLRAIRKAENREMFSDTIKKLGMNVSKGVFVRNLIEAKKAIQTINLPIVVRPSFTLGGTGGGFARTEDEYLEVVQAGLEASIIGEVLVEESLVGWKEFELEVIRDLADNVIIVCSIENFDPMGVHTGDSITVAPAQTLTDRQYQDLRDAAIKIIREIGVETGGSNIQFAVNPQNGEVVVIEMNPRVSRSSALASKATGFPIAKVAAKLAVGYTLDELKNDITQTTPASFEPAMDYCVVKIPRWDFEKFHGTEDALGIQMRSIGEAMAMGRTFKEAFQKAIRSLEIGRYGWGADGKDAIDVSLLSEDEKNALKSKRLQDIQIPSSKRIFLIRDAMLAGATIDEVFGATYIDKWFLKLNARIKAESEFVDRLYFEIGKVIVGQRYVVNRLLIGLLTNGHILLEGVPGLAKTLTVSTLAKAIKLKFQRIQFTPDLLPADLIGTMIYNQKEMNFSTKKGPIFSNLVLADEINRSPAKVQSALLEAMQEKQVTIGEVSYKLENPFLVLATQNPVEQEGTYPLPEAQVDRFMMKLKVGYPTREEELEILKRMAKTTQQEEVNPVVSSREILFAREVVNDVYMDNKVERYIVDIVFATREPDKFGLSELKSFINYGASPRATINLTLAANASAFLNRRGYATPEDVKTIAFDVLRHRIIPTYEAEAEEVTSEDIIRKILNAVNVP